MTDSSETYVLIWNQTSLYSFDWHDHRVTYLRSPLTIISTCPFVSKRPSSGNAIYSECPFRAVEWQFAGEDPFI